MKKNWLFLPGLVLMVSLCALLMTTSCSGTRETTDTSRPTLEEELRRQDEERIRQTEERQAWQQARASDTIEAYEAYLEDFPEGRYRGDANTLIAGLRAQQQQQQQQQPEPEPEPEPEPPVETDRDRLIREDNEAWEQAGREDTIDAFILYLEKFPDGQYRNHAISKIRIFEQESAAEAQAQQARETDPFSDSMVRVRGGSFTMGCSAVTEDICERTEFRHELPRHRVTVSDFYIGKYPVTQRQWSEIMGSNPSATRCNNCPVTDVSWHDVEEFINRLNRITGLNYRLPTEAEWEFAARGGNLSRNFAWAGSNDPNRVAIYDENSNQRLGAVRQKSPNELGLYDMSGLVYEWCYDWYADYTAVEKTNPRGPSSGHWRIIRGGSYQVGENYCRVSHRSWRPPNERREGLGFRLARDI